MAHWLSEVEEEVVRKAKEKKEINDLLAQVKGGNVKKQYTLAQRYQRSPFVRDVVAAFHWYTRASQAGDKRALKWLKQDPEDWGELSNAQNFAIEMYQLSERDDPAAFLALGECYRREEGVPFSEDQAIEYYTEAANLGHRRAMIILAHYYFERRDHFQRRYHSLAIKWCKLALSNWHMCKSLGAVEHTTLRPDYARTMCQLAECYALGIDTLSHRFVIPLLGEVVREGYPVAKPRLCEVLQQRRSSLRSNTDPSARNELETMDRQYPVALYPDAVDNPYDRDQYDTWLNEWPSFTPVVGSEIRSPDRDETDLKTQSRNIHSQFPPTPSDSVHLGVMSSENKHRNIRPSRSYSRSPPPRDRSLDSNSIEGPPLDLNDVDEKHRLPNHSQSPRSLALRPPPHAVDMNMNDDRDHNQNRKTSKPKAKPKAMEIEQPKGIVASAAGPASGAAAPLSQQAKAALNEQKRTDREKHQLHTDLFQLPEEEIFELLSKHIPRDYTRSSDEEIEIDFNTLPIPILRELQSHVQKALASRKQTSKTSTTDAVRAAASAGTSATGATAAAPSTVATGKNATAARLTAASELEKDNLAPVVATAVHHSQNRTTGIQETHGSSGLQTQRTGAVNPHPLLPPHRSIDGKRATAAHEKTSTVQSPKAPMKLTPKRKNATSNLRENPVPKKKLKQIPASPRRKDNSTTTINSRNEDTSKRMEIETLHSSTGSGVSSSVLEEKSPSSSENGDDDSVVDRGVVFDEELNGQESDCDEVKYDPAAAAGKETKAVNEARATADARPHEKTVATPKRNGSQTVRMRLCTSIIIDRGYVDRANTLKPRNGFSKCVQTILTERGKSGRRQFGLRLI